MRTKIIKNKNFYAILPDTKEACEAWIIERLREDHPDKLKHARTSSVEATQYDLDKAGILLRVSP